MTDVMPQLAGPLVFCVSVLFALAAVGVDRYFSRRIVSDALEAAQSVLATSRPDPRVALMEALWQDPAAKADLFAHIQRLFPQANVADLARMAAGRPASDDGPRIRPGT